MDENQGNIPETPDTAPAPESGADITNLKQEFNRKLSETTDKMSNQINQLVEAQNQLLQRLESSKQQASEPAGDDLDDLWYSNPTEAAKRIKEETQAAIRQEYEQEQARQAAQNQVVTQLTQQYPELQNTNSSLTQKVYEIYGKMSPEEQKSPSSLKAAVYEAANEVGVLPASQRKAPDENFSVGASTGKSKPPKKDESELSDATLQWAQLLGLNTDDENVKKRLKKRADRKNWMRYE